MRIAWAEGGKQRVAVFRTRKARGGRLRLSGLHLPDPTPIGLRELRLGAVEQLINLPDVRAAILERMDEDAPDVFEPFSGITIVTGATRGLAGRVCIKTGAGVAGTHASGSVELERPTTRKGFDDQFYRQVLQARDTAIRNGEPVLRALQEASGAPHDTVARWLKEARRRERLQRRKAAT